MGLLEVARIAENRVHRTGESIISQNSRMTSSHLFFQCCFPHTYINVSQLPSLSLLFMFTHFCMSVVKSFRCQSFRQNYFLTEI